MSKHNHKECKHGHIFKHCEECDLVYCDYCGKEWVRPDTANLYLGGSGPSTGCNCHDSAGNAGPATGCNCSN